MASIFTKIINGEIPSYTIAENDDIIAFLDISPLAVGHTLVVPKKEVDYYFNLSEADFAKLNSFAKLVAIAIEKAIPCKRIGVAVIGLEVPHAHVHLIPINNVSDIDFSREKLTLSPIEMKQTAIKIRNCFE